MTLRDARRLAPQATVRIQVDITGIVQGVGFRPAVARMAARHHLTGTVTNESGVVRCEFEGPEEAVAAALDELRTGPTPLSRIDNLTSRALNIRNDAAFVITPSRAGGTARTLIPADVATCAQCLDELRDSTNRRHGHPFITCTDCGPRYTVISDLPYDRVNTTMSGFPMCDKCHHEYEDPTDRRFHAETIACPHCGPRLEFRTVTGQSSTTDNPIEAAADALRDGRIVAIKGIGGFHFACRADLTDPIATLRARKGRPDKPFAVMVADDGAAAELIELTDDGRAALCSPAAPVVIAPRRPATPVVEEVAPRLADLGVMIAYTPIHHLLFDHLGPIPLVMTSANASGSPILFRDSDIGERLAGIADAVLTHDRPVHVPCEDSVLQAAADGVVPLRRSRGAAPLPVTGLPSPTPVVATGGDLKTTFCLLADDGHAHMSAHLGDMSDPRTQESFTDALNHLQTMTAVAPGVIACDMHPRYATTAWARRSAERRPVIEVQHHHAHAVSLLAEHHLLGTPAVVLAFDGTGYGTDGVIWGGEFLAIGSDPGTFTRVAHLAEFALPGADTAIREPSRIALDLLWRSGIQDIDRLPPAVAVGDLGRRIIAQQRDKGLGCPATTSVGRLFDGVAALLGICAHVTYEGQAAIELEARARGGRAEAIAPPAASDDLIDYRPIIRHLVEGIRGGRPQADLAASFQQWLVDESARVALRSAAIAGAEVIGLSGGVFANSAVRQGIVDRLNPSGVRVLTHRVVPPNDGGLALGQACVAAATIAAPTERRS
ncbi:carbamoyltransferase HypF [Gordonia sp. NPDC003424]